jgi:hypothetical protein
LFIENGAICFGLADLSSVFLFGCCCGCFCKCDFLGALMRVCLLCWVVFWGLFGCCCGCGFQSEKALSIKKIVVCLLYFLKE